MLTCYSYGCSLPSLPAGLLLQLSIQICKADRLTSQCHAFPYLVIAIAIASVLKHIINANTTFYAKYRKVFTIKITVCSTVALSHINI